MSDQKETCAAEQALAKLTEENAALRKALGVCPVTSDGKHEWAFMLTDEAGRIARGPHGLAGAAYGKAGPFCQNCAMPRSPFHQD